MYGLTRALRRLWALPPGERRVVLEAAVVLPAVHAVQQALPFRRWRALLTWPHRQAPRAGAPSPEVIAHAVERARRTMPGEYKCLPAAYATHLLLSRYGYASEIQVGVARDAAGKVEAHAWVEHEGRTLIGALPDLVRFVPLPPLRL